MKHTAGPWMYMHEIQKVDEKFELHFHTVRTGDKNIVRVPSEFDARLIAQAPAMLEALIKHYYKTMSIYNQFNAMLGNIDLNINTVQCEIQDIIESATGQKIDDILQATGQKEGRDHEAYSGGY